MNTLSQMIEAHIFRQHKENNIEFLLLKRSGKVIYPGLWQMVNGKIKEGEKAYQAALREIKEETGLIPLRLWVVPNVNLFYSHEKDTIMKLPVFAAEVENLSAVKISDEHVGFKWVNSNEAKKMLAWPGQRKSIELICHYFLNERNFLDLVEIL